MARPLGKRERLLAVLSGQTPDRIPVSAWMHLIPAEADTSALADAALDYFRAYDWDWFKVNPRASQYAEAWGSEFDFADYRGVLPRFVRNRNDPFDPAALEPVPLSHPAWAAHLDLLAKLKKGLAGAPFIQTVFSPAAALGYLAGRPTDHAQLAAAASHTEALLRLIRENPAGAHRALAAIASTLSAYARACLDAGADGIFFAAARQARRGLLTEGEFAEFCRPYDLQVLSAVSGATFNLLHLCGSEAHWDAVQDYPVHALNWASAAPGNPSLAEAAGRTRFVLVGGVDEEGALLKGSPSEVGAEARRALLAGGSGRFMLAPGCCVDQSAPAANLHALRAAVDRS